MSLADYKTKDAASKLINAVEECAEGGSTMQMLDNIPNVPVDESLNMADEVKTAATLNMLLTDLKAKGYMAKD